MGTSIFAGGAIFIASGKSATARCCSALYSVTQHRSAAQNANVVLGSVASPASSMGGALGAGGRAWGKKQAAIDESEAQSSPRELCARREEETDSHRR